jgi:hypothetical protein
LLSGRLENFVDDRQEPTGGGADLLQVRDEGGLLGGLRLFHQHLAVADDLVDRRAQLVAERTGNRRIALREALQTGSDGRPVPRGV